MKLSIRLRVARPPRSAFAGYRFPAEVIVVAVRWYLRYRARAGIEGTIHQTVTVTGARRARYTGLGKVELEHAFAATAIIRLIRLNAWWTHTPLQRTRTTHLARLNLAPAA